jgi:hypothetical protein
MHIRTQLTAALAALVALSVSSSIAAEHRVGVAAVDVTPDYPVRLSGFGFRRTESEGVTQRIWAKAIAFADDGRGPAVIVCVDNLAVPWSMTQEVAARLAAKAKVDPTRFTLTCTHTHTAPMLSGVTPTLFGTPIPPDHQKNIDRYTRQLADAIEQVALSAVQDIRPAKLEFGIGAVDFAVNRRTQGGPVDHDLPVLAIKGADGKLRAVYLGYACHCVTLSNNKISGDWAGYIEDAVRKNHPGVVLLTSVGCGADANPSSGVTGDKADVAAAQGAQIAKEVERLLGQPLKPITAPAETKLGEVELLFDTHPTRAEWEQRVQRGGEDAVGYHARVQLAKLDRGETLQTTLPYPIQTWTFGDQLAMVFLPGEVVVDYSLRLKREFDRGRIWVNAYSNDEPCYIPSERVLKEGGYEGADAMIYYDRPTKFAPGLEQKIIDEVHRQLPASFTAAPAEARASVTADNNAPDAQALAKLILDKTKPDAEREAAANANAHRAAELVPPRPAGLAVGTPAEYEAIPWVWRVAVACGRKNQTEPLRKLIEVSLPKEGEPLRDWQAVVIGGGVINGISDQGVWPAKRVAEIIGDNAGLRKRWQYALDRAAVMTDDEKVATPTRYDALRMLGVEPWEKRGEQLTRYLKPGTNEELQMGAVSGLADVDAPQATAALVAAVPTLAEGNRNLALNGLLRSESRTSALLDAIAAGKIDAGTLGAERVQKLRSHPNEPVRRRAAELLKD